MISKTRIVKLERNWQPKAARRPLRLVMPGDEPPTEWWEDGCPTALEVHVVPRPHRAPEPIEMGG